MKRLLFALVAILTTATSANAQLVFGNTGLANVPTADMRPAGTFVGGATFLPNSYLSDNFKYNTGMYYFTFSPFSWAELTFRETLCRGRKIYYDDDNNVVYGNRGFYQQDRSYTIRLRPLQEKEGKWWPGVVLGANDPWSDNGGSYYNSLYGVVTKHLNIKGFGDIGMSAGYFYPFRDRFGDSGSKAYNGVFGGIGYTPAFWDQMLICADYDTQGINLAVNVRLFHHWNILVYERDFKKLGIGMSYQYTIKY